MAKKEDSAFKDGMNREAASPEDAAEKKTQEKHPGQAAEQSRETKDQRSETPAAQAPSKDGREEAPSETTYTQVGVSGKKITSVVKKIRVIKRRPAPAEAVPEEATSKDSVLELSVGELREGHHEDAKIEVRTESASADSPARDMSEATSVRAVPGAAAAVETEVPRAAAQTQIPAGERPQTLPQEPKAAAELKSRAQAEAISKDKAAESKKEVQRKRSKTGVKIDDDTERRLLAQLNGYQAPVKVKSGSEVREEKKEAAKRQIEEERRRLEERREQERRKKEEEALQLERLQRRHEEERRRKQEEERAQIEKQREERMRRLSAEIAAPVKIGNIRNLQRDKATETAAGGEAVDTEEARKARPRHSSASRAAVEATRALEHRHRAKHEQRDEEGAAKAAASSESSTTPEENVRESSLEERLGLNPNAGRKIGKIGKIQDGSNPFAATAEALRRKRERSERPERGERGAGAHGNRPHAGGARNFAPGRASQGVAFDKDAEEDRQKRMPSRAPKKKSTQMDAFLQNIGGKESGRNFQTRTQFERGRRNDGNTRQQNPKQGRNMGRDARVSRGNFMTEGFDEDGFIRRSRRKNKGMTMTPDQSAKMAQVTHVSLPSHLTVKEFAEAIKKSSAEVIMKLMGMGMMATVNQDIDYDTAALIAGEFNIEADPLKETSEEDLLFDNSEDDSEATVERPPVVVVMGHVDHGKTSLLDYIRNTRVTAGEAGGITQAIGAYRVNVNERQITFLDTPGHEAFTAMRARGAQATDIAILVVAADDGVMPQTIEAINHAKAAGTEIIVAINKMDKPGANPERVRQELVAYDLIPDEWGGTTTMVEISAKTGQGIDDLLEMVLLTADAMELKADPDRQAKGFILEAKLDPQRGSVASLLVQRGTLRKGDTIVTSHIVGNIRAMIDETGREIEEAGPATPVEILGLPEVPEAGEVFYQVSDERLARQLADKRRIQAREESLSKGSRTTLDNFYEQISSGEVKDLNILIKADVVGSVEAMKQSLLKLSNDEVKVKIVHGAAGGINESDIRLAEVTNAIIIGFNVRTTGNAAQLAKDAGVDIRLYRVIYNAIEDIEAALKGMLAPEFVEEITGHIEIREIFHVSSVGTIGGAYVSDGMVERHSDIRLVRDGVVVMEGKLASLRRFKDDVKEVREGFECGLSIERYNDIKVGDVVEAYRMTEVKRS